MRRDFSERSKSTLLQMVKQVEDEKLCDFTDWIGDRWYDYQYLIGELHIKNYLDNVNAYHRKVIDKNNTTRQAIQTIFREVTTLDNVYRDSLAGRRILLEEAHRYMNALSRIVNPQTGRFSVDSITSSLKPLLDELAFDDFVIPPDYMLNNIDIIGGYDITANFLDGRNQTIDALGCVWDSDWLANALSLIGIGEDMNESAVRNSIETLISKTLKERHKVTDFTDDCIDALTPEELKDFKKVIDYSISVGRTITEAEIANILNIDVREVVESDYLQFILAQKN